MCQAIGMKWRACTVIQTCGATLLTQCPHRRSKREPSLISLKNCVLKHPRSVFGVPFNGTDDIEIGGRLLKIAWGSGYSIEGGQALLQYAFDDLKRPRVVSMCHPDNRAAAMSLIALGFLREGVTHHYERELPFFVLSAQRWQQQAALELSWRKLARLNIRAVQ